MEAFNSRPHESAPAHSVQDQHSNVVTHHPPRSGGGAVPPGLTFGFLTHLGARGRPGCLRFLACALELVTSPECSGPAADIGRKGNSCRPIVKEALCSVGTLRLLI